MRPEPVAGSIYDLGYRTYSGARLGRAYAIASLFWFSLRSIFGIGRSWGAKFFAFGFAVVALLPAVGQLAVAAIAPEDLELIRPEEYFGYVQIVIALFCAVSAPEIIGRDQRSNVLTLYFSRALSRADYVTAKLAALVVAIYLVNVVPQALLMLGGAVAENGVLGYLGDHSDRIAPILASCAIVSVFMASVSLAIASQSPRRAISTGAVLGFFVIFTAIGNILLETVTGSGRKYTLLISPTDTLDGVVNWMFKATPDIESSLAKADLDGIIYFVAAVAYTLVALAFLYRRYQRIGA
jgi:ABC-2 type transport system permease protein